MHLFLLGYLIVTEISYYNFFSILQNSYNLWENPIVNWGTPWLKKNHVFMREKHVAFWDNSWQSFFDSRNFFVEDHIYAHSNESSRIARNGNLTLNWIKQLFWSSLLLLDIFHHWIIAYKNWNMMIFAVSFFISKFIKVKFKESKQN